MRRSPWTPALSAAFVFCAREWGGQRRAWLTRRKRKRRVTSHSMRCARLGWAPDEAEPPPGPMGLAFGLRSRTRIWSAGFSTIRGSFMSSFRLLAPLASAPTISFHCACVFLHTDKLHNYVDALDAFPEWGD